MFKGTRVIQYRYSNSSSFSFCIHVLTNKVLCWVHVKQSKIRSQAPPMLVHKYVDENQVLHEMWIWGFCCMQATKHTSGVHPVFETKADVTRSPTEVSMGPQKGLVSSNFFQTRMHSSRMSTARSLLSVQEGGLCPGGSLSGGSLSGGPLSRGASVQGGFCSGGVSVQRVSVPLIETPLPPVNRMADRQV